MKGRIKLASAARKASAKGRLSRARVGARSMGGEGPGERGEREERAQHAREPRKHTTGTQTQQHRTILISRLLVCTVGEDGGRSWAAVQ